MIKDCAFQLYIDGEEIQDTVLITRQKAEELYLSYKDRLMEVVQEGKRFELALWINMNYDTNYSQALVRISEDDVVVKHGRLYVLTSYPQAISTPV